MNLRLRGARQIAQFTQLVNATARVGPGSVGLGLGSFRELSHCQVPSKTMPGGVFFIHGKVIVNFKHRFQKITGDSWPVIQTKSQDEWKGLRTLPGTLQMLAMTMTLPILQRKTKAQRSKVP